MVKLSKEQAREILKEALKIPNEANYIINHIVNGTEYPNTINFPADTLASFIDLPDSNDINKLAEYIQKRGFDRTRPVKAFRVEAEYYLVQESLGSSSYYKPEEPSDPNCISRGGGYNSYKIIFLYLDIANLVKLADLGNNPLHTIDPDRYPLLEEPTPAVGVTQKETLFTKAL